MNEESLNSNDASCITIKIIKIITPQYLTHPDVMQYVSIQLSLFFYCMSVLIHII